MEKKLADFLGKGLAWSPWKWRNVLEISSDEPGAGRGTLFARAEPSPRS